MLGLIVSILLLLDPLDPAPRILRSEPIPSGDFCKSDPDAKYVPVFPSDLRDSIAPDVGVIVFAATFAQLKAVKLTLQLQGDKGSTGSIQVIATAQEKQGDGMILRAFLPPLQKSSQYSMRIEAPLGRCIGDYNGTLGVLRTGAK